MLSVVSCVAGVRVCSILHSCILSLLREKENPRPEDVECLCKLMVTVGGQLSSTTKAEHKNAMQFCFNRLQSMRDNPVLESRIRFMIQVSHPRDTFVVAGTTPRGIRCWSCCTTCSQQPAASCLHVTSHCVPPTWWNSAAHCTRNVKQATASRQMEVCRSYAALAVQRVHSCDMTVRLCGTPLCAGCFGSQGQRLDPKN